MYRLDLVTTSFSQSSQPLAKVVWTATVNSLDVLAGMLAIGVGITSEINRHSSVSYELTTESDVSSFRFRKDIAEEDVCVVSPLPKKYGLWLAGQKRFSYDLYTFSRGHFLQGVISLASVFSVDFRNYLYGVPYDRQGQLYLLAGYRLISSNFSFDVLDSNDVDEEEKDNESLIEGFHKDY